MSDEQPELCPKCGHKLTIWGDDKLCPLCDRTRLRLLTYAMLGQFFNASERKP